MRKALWMAAGAALAWLGVLLSSWLVADRHAPMQRLAGIPERDSCA
jgi:hypothetical protein